MHQPHRTCNTHTLNKKHNSTLYPSLRAQTSSLYPCPGSNALSLDYRWGLAPEYVHGQKKPIN